MNSIDYALLFVLDEVKQAMCIAFVSKVLHAYYTCSRVTAVSHPNGDKATPTSTVRESRLSTPYHSNTRAVLKPQIHAT